MSAFRPLTGLLTNRNFIFILGIGLGFLIGPRTIVLKEFTPYIIGFILAISLSSFSLRNLVPLTKSINPVLACILTNYIIFGTLVLIPAWLLTESQGIWIGYVIIAATPPAIAIIPFSFNLNGDTDFSILGVFGGNLMGILITPLIFFLILGKGLIDPVALVKILLTMLIIPLFVSRLFRHHLIYPVIDSFRGIIIDYGFFLIALTIIGLSRDLLFQYPGMIMVPALIFLFVQFIFGSLFKVYMKKRITDKKRIMSLSLMLTVKNSGFAAVVAISLFDDPMIFLPAATLSVIMPLFYIYESNFSARLLR